jgi:predicted RNA-binding Zn-ribbon protein involved in translation (DUF1610 family)
MDDERSWNLSLVACRGCHARMPLRVALVHMGAADLFACPHCGHQEVWRKAVEAVATPQRTANWWEAGSVMR